MLSGQMDKCLYMDMSKNFKWSGNDTIIYLNKMCLWKVMPQEHNAIHSIDYTCIELILFYLFSKDGKCIQQYKVSV